MKEADSYESVVNKMYDRILDTDYHIPTAFSDLTGSFPIVDVTEHLLSRIPDCSEDQLLRVIWYCKHLPITEDIENIYYKAVTEGVDDIQEVDSVQNVIHSTLYTDTMASMSLSSVNKKQDEIEMLRDWQEDPSFSSSVHLFAEEAEDQLLEGVESREELFRE